MIITWHGGSCVKIQSGNMVIVADPYSKEAGLASPRFSAQIVTRSHEHSHLQTDSVGGSPFVIDGPGEYEIGGVHINGVETHHDNSNGKERGLNTAFIYEIEDMRIAHMGDIGEEKLRGETIEALETIDILFVPVGGKHAIDGAMAKKITDQIEPRIVIPINYKLPKTHEALDSVDVFLKEIGAGKAEKMDKLVIKKKDLPQTEETRVVVLSVA
ncbi:MAG: MBL fold metallo-hydrolase [Patescibacteria group bacterium]